MLSALGGSFAAEKMPQAAQDILAVLQECNAVVSVLGEIFHLDPKTLARQLQEALAYRWVSMEYTNALQRAARMLGNTSYPSTTCRVPNSKTA